MPRRLLSNALGELLEKSLPTSVENEIVKIVMEDHELSDIHELRTRRVGTHIAIEMHVRMPGDLSLTVAHAHATEAERRLRKRFGNDTFISIHMEPKK